MPREEFVLDLVWENGCDAHCNTGEWGRCGGTARITGLYLMHVVAVTEGCYEEQAVVYLHMDVKTWVLEQGFAGYYVMTVQRGSTCSMCGMKCQKEEKMVLGVFREDKGVKSESNQ